MFRKTKKENISRQSEGRQSLMDSIIKASGLLTRDMNYKRLVSVLVEQSLDVTRSDISVFYGYSDPEKCTEPLERLYKRGRWDVADELPCDDPLVDFIEESRETVIIHKKSRNIHFPSIFLHDDMKSAIALPVFTADGKSGILLLNSQYASYYNNSRFQFLDSLAKLASGMLNNARLFSEMKESYRRIEEMQRYQESIFSSMTDLLLTLDSEGNLYYANREASEVLGYDETWYGRNYSAIFKGKISSAVMTNIGRSISEGTSFPSLSGIYREKSGNFEMDYKLNISPLKGVRGKKLGTILLFTDETKEKELMKRMNVATEERRQIKDMFARYLSNDLVNNLIEKPDLVKPGGADKQATVFFADIRGYTSFSEGKEPAYIIEILNEYFNEAVEIVIQNKGYIDKFIGDCIMAAWGVPMMTEEEDAVNAVTCALQIQGLIKSTERKFFRGHAENLKVGIGMHSGHLVAGNLGSQRRMDYTIIGDTVNLAARLEGVAEAGEVIITESTRSKLGDHFKLEKRDSVKVKGKKEPIPIYNVLERLK